jgi:uncharacterized protein YjeT (DUF2065 family)
MVKHITLFVLMIDGRAYNALPYRWKKKFADMGYMDDVHVYIASLSRYLKKEIWEYLKLNGFL